MNRSARFTVLISMGPVRDVFTGDPFLQTGGKTKKYHKNDIEFI